MKPEIVARLLELNRVFYEAMGSSFSQTRQRLQPGVKKILHLIPQHSSILDVGCGNGWIVRELDQLGFKGSYVGVDASLSLLSEARKYKSAAIKTDFIQADITLSGWEELLPTTTYDILLAFAVFHHLPSKALRMELYYTLRKMIRSGGVFFHSYWQPLNSSKMRHRIQPWALIGMKPEDVEEGDYLLDWRHGRHGLRYVHHTTPNELLEAAEKCGFVLAEEFYSDGENNQLGYYQIWRPRLSLG